ncbi:hypothetical protein JW824_14745 [bacterium]|nr:hypothetical protein [bacterium]
MKWSSWQILLGLFLITLSAIFYLIHFTIFHDSHHIFIYLLGDVAFVPIEVLLVTLIIHKMLSAREKKALLHKMNMVIGTFFSEVGRELIQNLSIFNPHIETLNRDLKLVKEWPAKKFDELSDLLRKFEYTIKIQKSDLKRLKQYLIGKRDFLLQLLGNPNLLEHDTFTNLLWAVFHLTDELSQREKIDQLPDSDLNHLSGDIKRVYHLLVSEWLDYMQHLKDHYPYLFSLAMRTNPFDHDASPVVE